MSATVKTGQRSLKSRVARAAGALLTALIMVIALAAPAMAAPRPLTLDLLMDDGCMLGYAKPGTAVKFTVKDSSGMLKGRDVMLAASDGSWYGCVDYYSDGIDSGDRIKVLDYDTHQQLNYTVPRLTLTVNRVTDVASGKAAAGMKLELEAYDFSGPLFGHDPYDEIKHVTANGSGSYSHDFGHEGIDLMAGAQLEVRATGAGGAVTLRRDMVVPGLFLTLGQASFGGYMAPYRHLGITLKLGGSTVATGDAVGDTSGEFSSKFLKADSESYRVAGGEKLKAPALGISWTVPHVDGTANRATDVVSGTCFANGVYVVVAGFDGFDYGTANSSGHFSVDLSYQLHLHKGDQVLIACATNAGDFVEQSLTVN